MSKFEVVDLEEYATFCPSSRYGHTSLLVDDLLFIFGGSDGIQFLNEMVVFNLTEMMWEKERFKPKNSQGISGLHFMSGVYSNVKKKLYYFGGKSNGYRNNLITFDTNNYQFSIFRERDMENVPSKRYGHSSTLHGGSMYVFGGYDSNGWVLNSLYKCDIEKIDDSSEKYKWVEIKFDKNPIPRRYFHSGIKKDNKYFIINGLLKDYSCANDIWIIDLEKEKIEEFKVKKKFLLSIGKKKKFKSYGQQSFLCGGKIYVYGGRNKKEDNQFFGVLEKGGWRNLQFPFNKNSLLSYSSVSVYEDKICFFGGQRKIEVKKEMLEKTKNPFEMPTEICRYILSYLRKRDYPKLSLISLDIQKQSDYLWEPFLDRKLDKKIDLKLKLKDEKKFLKKVKKLRSFRERYVYVNQFFNEREKIVDKSNRFKGLLYDETTGEYHVKLVLVGDGAVGKTTLLIAYAENRFPDDYTPTIFDNYTCTVTSNNQFIQLGLWDTAGEEDYDTLRPLSYPVNRTSLENAKLKWYPEITKYAPDAIIVLVGLKMDLREDSQIIREMRERGEKPITRQDGEKMAREIKADYYIENSSKLMKNVKETFDVAVSLVLENENEKGSSKCGIM